LIHKIQIKKINTNRDFPFQAWYFENGVLKSYEYPQLSLGLYESLALVSKQTAPSTPTASVKIQNESGGTVYISYEIVHNGESQTIQVPKGATLRAINTNGNVLVTQDISEDHTIKLTPPGPTFQVALHNATIADITVTVEGTHEEHFVKANSTSAAIIFPKDAVLLATSSRPETTISPARHPVTKVETVDFIAGLFLDGEFSDVIHEWLPDKEFILLYKADRDGFGPLDFHRACDGKGATLSVITTTEGYVFGGYTPDSWVTLAWTNNTNTFAFSLRNQHGISKKRYFSNGSYSTHTSPNIGPHFGTGIFHVGYSSVGTDVRYYNTDGKTDILSDAKTFTPKNVEVYSVKNK